MTKLTDITIELEKPFAIEDIDLLPKGKTERDGKTLCMALPYADTRVYQDRLNQLALGEWETPPPIALTVGDKLVTYVTIVLCGIAHTDVGEAGPGENQGTEAFAQAFKRSASQFGLGRYLYDLEKEWTPYNTQRKMIDLDRAAKLTIVRKMYQKAGITFSAQPVQIVDVTPIKAPNPWDLKKWFKEINQDIVTAQKFTFKDQPIKNLDDLTEKECLALQDTYTRWKVRFDEKKAS